MKWISVNDQLPERELEVLVSSPENKYVYMARLNEYVDNWETYEGCCGWEELRINFDKTHWMPLPQKPE